MLTRPMLSKLFTLYLTVLCLALTLAPLRGEAAGKTRVLLDSDMVEMFDDGVAMLMLLQSPQIELMGVTIVTGNTWTEDGAANAIRQLEGLGRSDIPVVIGTTPERIKARFANIKEEYRRFGRGHDVAYAGAADFPEPPSWQTAYRARFAAEPTLAPVEEDAADFIIRTVRENPGEITIAAIGPATNLAAAIEKDPGIVPLIDRVVYMSGAFFQQGNTTPAAEFNVWVDPESLKKVVRAPFREQIFFPLDVCEKMTLSADDFYAFKEATDEPVFQDMMNRHYLNGLFASGSDRSFIWDVLVAAYLLDPSIITEESVLPIDVNDTYSLSYGQTLAYVGYGPEGSQSARLVTNVDQERVLAMIRQVFDDI